MIFGCIGPHECPFWKQPKVGIFFGLLKEPNNDDIHPEKLAGFHKLKHLGGRMQTFFFPGDLLLSVKKFGLVIDHGPSFARQDLQYL